MGFLGAIGRLFSTEDTVAHSARAHMKMYPELSFREALCRSLLEDRPLWEPDTWNLFESWLLEIDLPEDFSDDQLPALVAEFERQARELVKQS